ncbi:hypothetical protein [Nocardioides sp. cx-173]|uniref:hypothetical protein n=1 Tax=Nocardioides sp. cx-173 TaxID=2898796 RepID=UPI001E64FDD8|nr:hypothetical protein [Nocardioides sp. cx-173]MCD4525200.1 hypothetical protein [Nocardioides sp. cx-173]UGB40102.1 hypothetical protein LQ940_11900 [Nocardioides sp. cx-173]
MHARATLPALGLALALAAAVPGAATADSPRRTAAGAAPSCGTGVVGQDSSGRILEHFVRNGRQVRTRRGPRLPQRITGLGYVDVRGKVTRLAATTVGGVPRMLTLRATGRHRMTASTTPFAQRGFAPVLFTDAYGYFAYSVDRAGVLHRWVLERGRGGEVRYSGRTRLGAGFAGLTALGTAGRRAKPAADLLYAVTAGGALRLLTVPLARPRAHTAQTLLRRGYAGVTELSAGYCVAEGQDVVIALDPSAGKATWTLISGLTTRSPSAHQRGAVRGRADWALHAVM